MEIVSRKVAIESGLTCYFTGKPCPNGHVDVRYVTTYSCKSCALNHHKTYRNQSTFKAKEMAYKAVYRNQNRQAINDYARDRWRNDPNARLIDKAWKDRNRDAIADRGKAANITPDQAEARKVARRKTYLKHRDDRIARAKDGCAKRRGAEGTFVEADIKRIMKMQSGKCAYCRVNITSNYHVDHIMPIALGGSNWPKNLQCLCPRCNLTKKAKHPLDWARQQGKLL